MSKTCIACSASDLDDGFAFCPFCGSELNQPFVCGSCGAEAPVGSAFCPTCGTALVGPQPQKAKPAPRAKPKAEAVDIPPPPSNGITIEFAYSTSTSFEFAVTEAQKAQRFTSYGEGRKALYRATYSQTELTNAIDLIEFVRGWRRHAVYVDGDKVPWDSVFKFIWCYRQKAESFKPNYYCFGYENNWQVNPWGCIQSEVPFTEHADWTKWGKWLNKKGDWQFDKGRIKHALEKNLYQYRFCPALNLDLVERAFEAFPEVVNPKKDKDWKFVEDWGESESGLVVVTTSYGYKQEVYMAVGRR